MMPAFEAEPACPVGKMTKSLAQLAVVVSKDHFAGKTVFAGAVVVPKDTFQSLRRPFGFFLLGVGLASSPKRNPSLLSSG